MRINITFEVNKNFTFNKTLNEPMTAFIYRCLGIADNQYSQMIHDNGFSRNGYKKFVYHTYVLLQDNTIVSNKLNKGVAKLIFSSAIDDTVIKFVQGLIKIGKIQLLGNSFNIVNIDYIKDGDVNEGLFKIISPVYMSDNKSKWLKPNEMEQYLINNLITKYNSLYGKLPKSMNMEIKFLNSASYYMYYKMCTMKSYFGVVAIKGDKELVELAYQSGLGSKNGIGLGLIENIKR